MSNAMIDYAVSDNCENLEQSYGEICVKCGKCGRVFNGQLMSETDKKDSE